MANLTEKLHEIGKLILQIERHEFTMTGMMQKKLEENAEDVEKCEQQPEARRGIELSNKPPAKVVVPFKAPAAATGTPAAATGMNAVKQSPVTKLANLCLEAKDGVCTMCEIQDQLVRQTRIFYKKNTEIVQQFEAYLENQKYSAILDNSDKFSMEDETTLNDPKKDILTGEPVNYPEKKSHMIAINDAELTNKTNVSSALEQIHARLVSIKNLQAAIISLLHAPSDCQEVHHAVNHPVQAHTASQTNLYLLTSGRATFRIACDNDEMGKTWECPSNQNCLQTIGQYLLKAPPDVKKAWDYLVDHEMLGPAKSLQKMRVARHFAHEREERALNLSRRERMRALRRGSLPKTLFVSVAKT